MLYPDTLTTGQTADMLGCPPSRVYRLAHHGMITGVRRGHGGPWHFDTESVLNYGMRGRPLPARLWRVTARGHNPRTYATTTSAAARTTELLAQDIPVTVHRATTAWDTHIDPVTGYQIPRGHSEYRLHQRIAPARATKPATQGAQNHEPEPTGRRFPRPHPR